MSKFRMRFFVSLFLFFNVFIINAQLGSSYAYAFLKLAPSARVTALGEYNVSIMDKDPSVQLANPSALNPLMHAQLSINQGISPGGMNFGNFSYTHDFKKAGTYGFGVQYMAYGNIPTTDESANITGSMSPADVAIYGGGSYKFGKLFGVGANLRLITSTLASNTSVGMSTDFAASVKDPKEIVFFSIVARNVGGQFKGYTAGTYEPIPFNLQAGLSFGFKVLPLRFHVNFHDLTNWNIRYSNPADQTNTNLFEDSTTAKAKSYAGDEFFRHMVIGVEANIKKIVFIDFAYNHQRRMEYKQDTRRGLAGFSFGLGLRIKQFAFHAGLTALPLKQTQGHLTLNINTAGFVKKKQ